jgi:hypothetical protein
LNKYIKRGLERGFSRASGMQGDFCEVFLIFDSDLSGGRYFYDCIRSRFLVKDKVKEIERRLTEGVI